MNRIIKLKKPIEMAKRIGPRGGHTSTVADVVPFLPRTLCFFDCRHFVCGIDIVPFAL